MGGTNQKVWTLDGIKGKEKTLLAAFCLACLELFILCDAPWPCHLALEQAIDWIFCKPWIEISFLSFSLKVWVILSQKQEKCQWIGIIAVILPEHVGQETLGRDYKGLDQEATLVSSQPSLVGDSSHSLKDQNADSRYEAGNKTHSRGFS